MITGKLNTAINTWLLPALAAKPETRVSEEEKPIAVKKMVSIKIQVCCIGLKTMILKSKKVALKSKVHNMELYTIRLMISTCAETKL